MIIGSKNKGDWSEFYVLLYLIGTRKLYAADEHLEKLANFCFPIKKIFRNDAVDERINFVLGEIDTVAIYLNDDLKRTMTSEEFWNEALELRRDILSGRGSFDISHAENFLNGIFLKRLAAPSQGVTDMTMEVHDTNTSIDQVMGFSIKSYFGGAPTLLNASGATNFVYEITGITDQQMDSVNSIETKNKIIDRMAYIEKCGGLFSRGKAVSLTFSENLTMVDSRMEEMLSEMLLISYKTNETECKKLIKIMEDENPLGFCRRTEIYAYKFKQFLCAKALGMEPAKEWSGEDNVNGGYIVVKSNGEVLAYHLYNRDKFRQYLLDNTVFERASTSRHNYAAVYKKDGKFYINLNLQIRFKQKN